MAPSPSTASFGATATGPPARKRRLVVPRGVFTCCWLGVVLVHVLSIVFTAALGGTHALVATPALYTYTASALQIDIKYLRLASRTFACVCLLHVLAVARILYYSIRRGQLCFRSADDNHKTPDNHEGSIVHSIVSVVFFPLRFTLRMWNRYFGIDGVLGLNGPHFDAVFHMREVLEILSQTYQAYFTSSLVSTRWINEIAVAIIVVGCVSTPTIHLLVRRGHLLRRVVCLVIDTVLDLCGSVVLPLIILYQNIKDFDWHDMMYPTELVYDHVWMARIISQGRLLFVWSYLDFFSTVTLQLSVLGCTLMIENSVVMRWRSRKTKPSSRATSLASVGPTLLPPMLERREAFKKARQTTARHKPRRRACMGFHASVIFFAWGVFVLLAHIYAQRDVGHEISSCSLDVNAWFSKRAGCAVVTVHCHRLGIAGSAHEITPILDQVERSTLVTLAFMHCPGFVPPDIIQEFHQLMSMDLTNVTLLSWPATAAIHRDFHSSFSHIFFGHVTLTEFPGGLFHPDVPLAMNDIDFSYTNLTVLPDALAEMWSNRLWLRINFEFANLTELPRSLARLPIRRISLIGNNLSSIPDELFQGDALTELYVSGNPLERLPASLGDLTTLERLFVEHTRVGTTNAWWDDWYARKIEAGVVSGGSAPLVFFHGSPICDTSESSLPSAQRGRMCDTDMGTARGGCPWDLIWRLRPV